MFRSWFGGGRAVQNEIAAIRKRQAALAQVDDAALRRAFTEADDLPDVVAAVAVAAARILKQEMFDVQLQGALALARGRIAEMQTGEGKTLACTPAVAWYARQGRGVHVMTVNDYLARRDARWMGGIYELLGLSVGCIQQTMGTPERRRAYACDIIQERRQAALTAEMPEVERLVTLTTIDDLWSQYLAAVTELRSGVHWYSLGGRDPLHEYLTRVDAMYRELRRYSERRECRPGNDRCALRVHCLAAGHGGIPCGKAPKERPPGMRPGRRTPVAVYGRRHAGQGTLPPGRR